MGRIIIDQSKAKQTSGLEKLCPFGAIIVGEQVEITSGCRFCKVCVKEGPPGAFSFVEEIQNTMDRSQWNGILVYAEYTKNRIHPVAFELIGKDWELAEKSSQQVYVGCR